MASEYDVLRQDIFTYSKLVLSSSICIFRHNSLLTVSAYLYVTCQNYNGHAARTGSTDTVSKIDQIWFFSQCI